MRDKDIYRLIGRRLRVRRRLLDMTQGEVAKRCGLTFQQIQKYEAGITAMPIGRLVALAQALKIPIESLFQGLPGSAASEVSSDEVSPTDTGRELAA